jgi:hypothetical protein
MDGDHEDWCGLTVRARNGTVLGVVVGEFAHGPLAGRLRLHGEFAFRRHPTWLWPGIVVFAIPRDAVVHRTRHSLVLNVTVATARARWFVHVLQREVAC